MKKDEYPERLTDGYYHVRSSWEDEESQVGQYKLLKSAVAKCDDNPGSHIFTEDGVAIYPEDEGIAGENTVDDTVEEDAPENDTVKENTPENETAAELAGEGTESSGNESQAKEPPGEESPVEESHVKDNPEESISEAGQVPETHQNALPPNDGNKHPILYGKVQTLLNVRDGNSMEAQKVAVLRKGVIVDILEVCDNGWYRIATEAAESGCAYINNENGKYVNVGKSIYIVAPADTLWRIAEKALGSGQRYDEIKALNGLISNIINVGMKLLIP